jgi:lipid-binding SYLF domain-containing protein
MGNPSSLRSVLLTITAILLTGATFSVAIADNAELDADGLKAYKQLISSVSGAKAISKSAVAVLVFPEIRKAGLVVGGQYGKGVLLKGGKPSGHYKTTGASYGLQIGAQKFGYAMFFMNQKALDALTESAGFEIGVGPSVVVVDEGMGKNLTTMTAKDDVYAFVFSQSGLMAGLGLQGNKITKLDE